MRPDYSGAGSTTADAALPVVGSLVATARAVGARSALAAATAVAEQDPAAAAGARSADATRLRVEAVADQPPARAEGIEGLKSAPPPPTSAINALGAMLAPNRPPPVSLPPPNHQGVVVDGVNGGGANSEAKDVSCTSGRALVGGPGSMAISTPTPINAAPPDLVCARAGRRGVSGHFLTVGGEVGAQFVE
ncbi:MAG: hypothetical protein QOE30_9 [Mycobacterium sp.]|nr:hypothetical protein [Mycobacterium sp.]